MFEPFLISYMKMKMGNMDLFMTILELNTELILDELTNVSTINVFDTYKYLVGNNEVTITST